MSQPAFAPTTIRVAAPDSGNMVLFWGCFVALITTAFAFVGRLFLVPTWAVEFGLDPAQAGRLAGIGIWPFAVSIILFSLVIDKVGYKTAMICAFLGHITWAVMGVAAYYVAATDKALAFNLLYWGSLLCALANGTVEAFVNPVVATMFNREKTKWLNILHAGWPGGLVITGLLLIGIDTFAEKTPWAVKVGLIAVPAVCYFLMLIGKKFPQNERVSAGVTYRDMLREFGTAGALVVSILVVLQLMDFFSTGAALSTGAKAGFIAVGVAMVVGFGIYTRSFGRPILFFLILIMMPLATTEIGTDGWITAIMEGIAKQQGFHPGWILVYTSAIMLVLRFFAGPIVHTFSPLGLLASSALFAIVGLTYLSAAQGMAIFVAATLYGFGKTFFWPTMLGVVSEQCPRGGAFTLNALGGIGMLAVGTLGFPFIGTLQTKVQQQAIVEDTTIAKKIPGLVQDGKVVPVVDKTIYEVISYKAIDDDKVAKLIKQEYPEASEGDKVSKELGELRERSNQKALRNMAIFPIFMFVSYIALILYFKTRGGYQAEVLTGHAADDEKFTGGAEGAMQG